MMVDDGLSRPVADGDQAQAGKEKDGVAGRRHGKVPGHDDDPAPEMCLALPPEHVGDPTSGKDGGGRQAGIQSIGRSGLGDRHSQASASRRRDHEKHEDRLHPIVAEALPHFIHAEDEQTERMAEKRRGRSVGWPRETPAPPTWASSAGAGRRGEDGTSGDNGCGSREAVGTVISIGRSVGAVADHATDAGRRNVIQVDGFHPPAAAAPPGELVGTFIRGMIRDRSRRRAKERGQSLPQRAEETGFVMGKMEVTSRNG